MSTQTKQQILFSNVAIRIYNLKKTSTNGLTILDLFRDEIKVLISITILHQLQDVITKESRKVKRNTHSPIELLIKKILLISKRKILKKLGKDQLKYKTTTTTYNTLKVLMQFENYKPLLLLVSHFAGIQSLNQNKIPVQLLLEHTVLQLSNLLLYYIFLNTELDNSILDTYTIDSILFTSYISKIKMYLAGKVYINNNILNKKLITPDTGSLFILTESGIKQKNIKFKSISKPVTTIYLLSKGLHLLETLSHKLIEYLVKR